LAESMRQNVAGVGKGDGVTILNSQKLSVLSEVKFRQMEKPFVRSNFLRIFPSIEHPLSKDYVFKKITELATIKTRHPNIICSTRAGIFLFRRTPANIPSSDPMRKNRGIPGAIVARVAR